MDREADIKERMASFADNIADFEVGDLLKDIDGSIAKITNKTINSIQVEIDKKPLKKGKSEEESGIKARQWFTMIDFNRRFKK